VTFKAELLVTADVDFLPKEEAQDGWLSPSESMRDSSPFEMGNPSKAPGTFQLDIYRVYLMLFISCWPFFSLKPTEMDHPRRQDSKRCP